MQMNDAAALLLAGLAGCALGGFFFGSLWWTVRQTLTLSSGRSALWHLGSLLLRMGVALIGFYAIGAGRWERLAACLAGFVMARMVVMWMAREWADRRAPTVKEAGHAPQP
ncbi:ATP synthase subunit I [Cupriavidus sp. D39]|uniref:ATP synthase subunit I n=1 Tax=Cupriavidus sp. D39 TaxID=2997877 RepID=UPI0022709217|nr:ATP synthase subunit I [Cupriavidus sp. D39]MCY0854764.1 ATP synthase subunit I [Cupriavidus sp. D39]